MTILCGWKIDGFIPEGGIVALLGMGIILYAPRN
jgi:small multidrug resistance family-3 protein